MNEVLVIGSLNMDLVLRVPAIVRPGETIKSLSSMMNSGGKGANQAVAVARAGASVKLFGAVGYDAFGDELRKQLTANGVDVSLVLTKPTTSTGMAYIQVDTLGENSIVILPGANGELTIEDLHRPGILTPTTKTLLLQNEIPLIVVFEAMELAKHQGIPVYYNPTPILPIPDEVLGLVHTLVVNRGEAEALTGMNITNDDQAVTAAEALLQKGCSEVLITLGKEGAIFLGREHDQPIRQAAVPVTPVDTTAAGDTMIGSFVASRLATGDVNRALEYSAIAAAIAVTRSGAQSSMPYLSEVEHFSVT